MIVHIVIDNKGETVLHFLTIDSVVTGSDQKYYCGTNTETTFEADADKKTCVVGAVFTVTLPYSAPAFYLHADGITTSFALDGITTTFVPEQTDGFWVC